jgi:hypothetical protein
MFINVSNIDINHWFDGEWAGSHDRKPNNIVIFGVSPNNLKKKETFSLARRDYAS